MEKILTTVGKYWIFIVALFAPMGAFALTLATAPIAAPSNTVAPTDISGISCSVINWMFYGLIVLAIVFVLLAAYKYVTGSGDPEKAKEANRMILYAAIAVAVALLAKAVPNFVAGTIGSPTLTKTC